MDSLALEFAEFAGSRVCLTGSCHSSQRLITGNLLGKLAVLVKLHGQ